MANSQICFGKISWIGPWVSRIDWCKGQWCGSTYMAVRMSDISSKTCIFCLFLSLRRTVSQPYRLSHINALRIDQSYWPKDQSSKFAQTFFENWRFWKLSFFESVILDFFCFIPMKIGQRVLGIKDGSKFWLLPWFPVKNDSPKHFSRQCK